VDLALDVPEDWARVGILLQQLSERERHDLAKVARPMVGGTIAAPIVGGMITSTIHVLILVPVFFAVMKERALRRGTLRLQADNSTRD
jgi:hypothetical protein